MCSRWDQEVRETRHKIMAAARFLLKNDMKFVAERDVETHIWKTVYYQVSSVHGSVVQEFFFLTPAFDF